MSRQKCGIKIIRENSPPIYDRRLCEKPIAYHRKRSKERTKGKSKAEIRKEFVEMCYKLGIEPTTLKDFN